MTRFSGKRILITGGTSGMGLAGARRIASEGGTLVVTGLNAKRIEASRRELPSDAQVLRNDAADPADIAPLIDAAKAIGGLDGLWLNAGYAALGSIEDIEADTFDRMMNANVRGPMLQLAKLSPLLHRGAGIVLTSSTSAYEGAAMTSLYAATKGAMVAMARSWASVLGARGIRVNVLVPGPIDTNLRSFMPAELRAQFEASVVEHLPLRRIGSANEAAAVALFLLSDEASFVTGSQYAVDGGLIMH